MDKFGLGLSRFINKFQNFRSPLLLAVALIALLGAALLVPSSGEASPPKPPPPPKKHKKDADLPFVSSIIRWNPVMERTDSDTLTWAVVFSEDVLNVDASDFDIDGTTASLSVASADTYLDSVYYATISGGDLPDLNGVVSIAVASDNDITSQKGKPLSSAPPVWNRNTYTVVNPFALPPPPIIPPRLLSVERKSPTAPITNVDSLTWRLAFSKSVSLDVSNFSVSGAPGVISLVMVPPEMIRLSGESLCKCELTDVSLGMIYDVTFSEGANPSEKGLADHNGMVTLNIENANSIVDEDGTPLASPVPEQTNEPVFILDNVAPVLSEVFEVKAPRPDTSPKYTFNSSEPGQITYGGSCASVWGLAKAGDNRIPLNPLAIQAHDNCWISVTDIAGNMSAPLAVSKFVMDAVPPRLASIERVWPHSRITSDDALMWMVSFSEPVNNVDVEDFEVFSQVSNVVGVVPVGLGQPGEPGAEYYVVVQGGALELLNGKVILALKDNRNIADPAGNPLTDEKPTGVNDNAYWLVNRGPDPEPPTVANLVIRDVRYNSVNLGVATELSPYFSPRSVLVATFEPHPEASITCSREEERLEYGWYNTTTTFTRIGPDGIFTDTDNGRVYQSVAIPKTPGDYMLLSYCVNGDQRSDALTLWGGSVALKSSE